MASIPKRIGILTGGGDCPGLNAVIRAVVKCAEINGIETVGILDGYFGLITNQTKPLNLDQVSGIQVLGGTILGSSNKDDPFHFVERDESGKSRITDQSDRALQTCKEHGLEALIVLGGDGTMTVADKLAAKGLKLIGVPKTIDNDLMGTFATFGFDTATAIATESIDRLHTTAASHGRIIVVEVMGRSAGWIALASGVAAGAHVIVVPEIPFDLEIIATMVRNRKAKGRRSTIIVAGEGGKPKGGEVVVSRIVENSPEAIRLGGIGKVIADGLETLTGIEARSVVLGHVVRGGSPSAHDRNLATKLGIKAVEMLLAGEFGRMAAVAHGGLSSVALSEVGGKVRTIPPDDPLLMAARKLGVSFGD
jgi:ATP-dependent phosphofructokinase / diphosphate-dependent phosphofructokinase